MLKSTLCRVLFSFQNLATTGACLCFSAQDSTPRPDVCGALLYFEISVYVVTQLLFKCVCTPSMGVHPNSLDDKACLAMLACIMLNSCLFSFSLLNNISGAIQRSKRSADVSGWLFCQYIFSKVTSDSSCLSLKEHP